MPHNATQYKLSNTQYNTTHNRRQHKLSNTPYNTIHDTIQVVQHTMLLYCQNKLLSPLFPTPPLFATFYLDFSQTHTPFKTVSYFQMKIYIIFINWTFSVLAIWGGSVACLPWLLPPPIPVARVSTYEGRGSFPAKLGCLWFTAKNPFSWGTT